MTDMKQPKPRASALRRGRVSLAGQIYLVTTVTQQREPVFVHLFAARAVARALAHEHDTGRARTLAYVLMPDHLHWLMQLGVRAPLSRVVHAVKSVSAHRLGRPIWQAGFHDHALRAEADLAETIRYVVANPLRAGLVRRLGDYPHWDAPGLDGAAPDLMV